MADEIEKIFRNAGYSRNGDYFEKILRPTGFDFVEVKLSILYADGMFHFSAIQSVMLKGVSNEPKFITVFPKRGERTALVNVDDKVKGALPLAGSFGFFGR